MKHHAPATARNREPIREVLARELPGAGTVLEIASGSGEHAVAFARAFPGVTWQPSDADPDALASIAAWRDEAALPNLAAPLALDVNGAWSAASRPSALTPLAFARWVEHADAIVCINMVHIAPWEAALGLFAGAGRLLAPGALLFLYGPYRFDGAFTAPSNAAFDQSLRARDPRWGVRDVADLTRAAAVHRLTLRDTVALPANNHALVFRVIG